MHYLRHILRTLLLKVLSEDPRPRLRRLGAIIGNGVFIGENVYIDEQFAQLLTIEDGAVISTGTSILLHDSAYNNVCGAPIKVERVHISKNVYVGVNCTILCGVTIGTETIVGAGSVVTRNIPSKCVAAGNPAKVYGKVSEFLCFYEQRSGWDILAWRERYNNMTSKQIKEAYKQIIKQKLSK